MDLMSLVFITMVRSPHIYIDIYKYKSSYILVSGVVLTLQTKLLVSDFCS